MDELLYDLDPNVSLADLNAEIGRAWNELGSRGGAYRSALNAGLGEQALTQASNEPAPAARTKGQGLDPATTAIIVAFAPVGAAIAKDVWARVLLPRLEKRFGVGVMKPRK